MLNTGGEKETTTKGEIYAVWHYFVLLKEKKKKNPKLFLYHLIKLI